MSGYGIKGLSDEEIRSIVRQYDEFYSQYVKYEGTNILHANQILNSVLDEKEKTMLAFMLCGDSGWYKTTMGKGGCLLKMISFSLGLGDARLADNKEKIEYIINMNKDISKAQQLIMMSAYIKQKFITLKTLQNNDQSLITLYRGIKEVGDKNQYTFCGLESWTNNINEAFKKAKGGYVIKKDYSINDVFVYYKSAFKNNGNLSEKVSTYINREKEFLIENNMGILPLEEGNNLYRYSDFL